MKNGWMGKMLPGSSCFHLRGSLGRLMRLFGVKGRWKKVKDLEFAVVGERIFPRS